LYSVGITPFCKDSYFARHSSFAVNQFLLMNETFFFIRSAFVTLKGFSFSVKFSFHSGLYTGFLGPAV